VCLCTLLTDATHVLADEIVAIKSVDATKFRSISEIEQIQEEMNVLSSLKHPNIIRLIEIHFMNSVFFMIMVGGRGGAKAGCRRSQGKLATPLLSSNLRILTKYLVRPVLMRNCDGTGCLLQTAAVSCTCIDRSLHLEGPWSSTCSGLRAPSCLRRRRSGCSSRWHMHWNTAIEGELRW
jgi:hypothetical protein